jgi:hypothetical protein
MNELRPLRSSSDDELTRAVLGSARADAPPAGASARVAVALGVSATLVASSAAASAGLAGAGGAAGASLGAASGTAGAGAVGASAGLLAGSSLATWAGVGVTAGLVTGLAGHVLTRPTAVELEQRTPAAVVSSAKVRRPSPAPVPRQELSPPATVLAPVPDLPVRELVARAPVARAPSAEPAQTAEPARGPSTLALEVRALDQVQRALEAGNGRAALAALERYRTLYAGGALTAESRVLRVKAHLLNGDRAGAEREAAFILRSAPGSRYAERVRVLLDRAGGQ